MDRPTITTTATARRTAVPERATVEVKATGEGDSSASALRTARDRAETVRTALREADLDVGRLTTDELTVDDSAILFEEETGEPYEAVERLRVECSPETVTELVVLVTDVGATVPNVAFELHDEVRREVADEALAAATERAREKAARIAATHDLEISGVQSVTTLGDDGSGPSTIVDDALADAGADDLSPEPITVSESVEVVYELAEA